MKLIAEKVRIRFASESGVDAARRRAEVGAPESLDREEVFNLEADVPIEVVARAEGANLLARSYGGVLPKIPQQAETVALGASAWGQDPGTQLALWIDLWVAERTAMIEQALEELLEKPVEAWIVSGIVQAPWFPHRDELVPLLARDERYQVRAAEAAELLARQKAKQQEAQRAAHAEQLARFNALDPAAWLEETDIEGDYVTVLEIRNRGFDALGEEDIEPRRADFSAAQARRQAAAESRLDVAREQFRRHAAELGGPAAVAVHRGYDVEELVFADVIQQLEQQRPCVAVLRQDTLRYNESEWAKRDSPNAEALALETELEEVIGKIKKPESMGLALSPVSRISLALEDASGFVKFTGCVVTMSSPISKDRCVLFSAE